MSKATKKVARLDEVKQKRAEVREGGPAHLSNREMRDMLNYGDPRFPESNPYNKLGTSREISARLLLKCQQLIPKITAARDILEKVRVELLVKHSRKDKKGNAITLPNELIVEQRIVEHFNKLVKEDKTNNVARLIERDQMDKVRKEIEDQLPLGAKRYDLIDMQAFENDFEEVLDQEADLGGMKKIVIAKGDLPNYNFFSAFERNVLSVLFEFDDLVEE